MDVNRDDYQPFKFIPGRADCSLLSDGYDENGSITDLGEKKK